MSTLPEPADVTSIESLCVQCGLNGVTQYLLTSIPHFKSLLIASFECPHCGYANKEVNSLMNLGHFGVRYTLRGSQASDLNRQIVRTDSAVITFVELELELPAPSTLRAQAESQGAEDDTTYMSKASLSTLEGIIRHVIDDLEADQEARKLENEVIYERIVSLVEALRSYLTAQAPFTLVLDDPSGNSYIESETTLPTSTSDEQPGSVVLDPHLSIERYQRTKEQADALGFSTERVDAIPEEAQPLENDEVYEFPGSCPSCRLDCVTRMHPLVIPYFKEVIIMATTCDACGYKSNEVKSGSQLSELGTKLILRIQGLDDMSRDILKSETAGIEIPDIELRLSTGTLGGRFTTIEGLLSQVRDEMSERLPFFMGDSATSDKKRRLTSLLDQLDTIMKGELPCTLILDDPLSNSYIQNLFAPDPDPQLTHQTYERSFEQNEDLGLNDMKVENY